MPHAGHKGVRLTNYPSPAIIALLALVAVLPLAAHVVPSRAAFPGGNGKIAFSSLGDGNYEIYVMLADGSGQMKLTNNPGYDADPAWSADGTKIAFWSNHA